MKSTRKLSFCCCRLASFCSVRSRLGTKYCTSCHLACSSAGWIAVYGLSSAKWRPCWPQMLCASCASAWMAWNSLSASGSVALEFRISEFRTVYFKLVSLWWIRIAQFMVIKMKVNKIKQNNKILTLYVRFHFILCVSAENVTLLAFNKKRKITKRR